MEILLVHPGGLGDVILSLPAAACLRSRMPSARITFAGNADHLVPVVSGYAHRILSIASLPLPRLFSHGALPDSDAAFWKSFDRIVSWTGAGNAQFEANFRALHAGVTVAAWKPRPGERRHAARVFLDSLESLTGPVPEVPRAPVILEPELRETGDRWLAEHGWNGRPRLVALHPGAGSAVKRWPVSRFAQLARRLALEKRLKILVVEGDAERGLGAEVLAATSGSGSILFDSMSLPLLAAVLARCRGFIGNDAGVAHLAAALDVPCVVLFGPTLPEHWAPLGPRVTVLRDARGCAGCASGADLHTCLENLSVEEAIRHSGFGAEGAAPRTR